MSSSETLLWISLALCVATGGSEVFYKRTGEEVTMDCPNVGLDSKRDVEWKYGSDRIIKILGRSGSIARGRAALASRVKADGINMRIPAVQMGDSGDYSCSGYDTRGNRTTRDHKLNVVSVSVSPSDTVLVYTDVTLRCDVPGDPAAQVQWMKSPGDEAYESPSNTVTLTSVTSTQAGQWICLIRDKVGTEVRRFGVNITVVGPIISSKAVVVPLGGTAKLPCFLPRPNSLLIVGGGWMRDPPADLRLPTLSRNASGLHWNGNEMSARVTFMTPPLNMDFNMTLNKVERADAGVYVCTVKFEGGRSLKTYLELKVEEVEEVNGPEVRFWEKRVLGVAVWVWLFVAAAVAYAILIYVIVARVVKHCRRKHRT
ncbi:hypothetical protein NFI96_009517, partial [Prochilodus magdalenae]